MTFLIATHYMDEAERCHRLAFISYGKLLTQGTVEDVIAEARLTTWVVDGPDLPKLAEEMRSRPGVEQAVAFGNELHVSGSDEPALEAAIAPHRKEPYRWRRVEPGLEDVFIHLMNRSEDNFS
jgi:ABC-2 type transport system ATP-binding protein